MTTSQIPQRKMSIQRTIDEVNVRLTRLDAMLAGLDTFLPEVADIDDGKRTQTGLMSESHCEAYLLTAKIITGDIAKLLASADDTREAA